MPALLAQRVALPARPVARLAASKPLAARAALPVQRTALAPQPLVRLRSSRSTLLLHEQALAPS